MYMVKVLQNKVHHAESHTVGERLQGLIYKDEEVSSSSME